MKAKLHNKERFKEKIQMRKMWFSFKKWNKIESNRIKAHEEKSAEIKVQDVKEGALPTYLLDREQNTRTKVLSNMVKQKRKEKAGKWKTPIQKVRALPETEMFQVVRSGKRKSKDFL